MIKWRVLNLCGNASSLAAVVWLRYMWNHGEIKTMALFWWAWPCVVLWMATIYIETHLRRESEFQPRGFDVEPKKSSLHAD